MTVYNVNLGIGWASSGVEYAQALSLIHISEPTRP